MSLQTSKQIGLPHSAGGLWDYLSPSRLNTWLSCPLKFRFRNVERIAAPTPPSLLVGKVVHAGLEALYNGRQEATPLEPGALIGRVRDCWNTLAAQEHVPFADSAQKAALRQQAVDLVLAYEGQLDEQEPRPIAVEETFSAPLIDPETDEHLGLDLLGVVDLVLDPVRPVIVDFKTAARGGQPNAIVHEVQLTSYAYLLRRCTGRQETGLEIRSLVKTRPPLIQIHRYPSRGAVEFRRLFAPVRAYLDGLTRGTSSTGPGSLVPSVPIAKPNAETGPGEPSRRNDSASAIVGLTPRRSPCSKADLGQTSRRRGRQASWLLRPNGRPTDSRRHGRLMAAVSFFF